MYEITFNETTKAKYELKVEELWKSMLQGYL